MPILLTALVAFARNKILCNQMSWRLSTFSFIIVDIYPITLVVSYVAPYMVDPIICQFKYLFLLSNNVKAIADGKDELRAKRESIERDIQNAEREGKDCFPEVEFWLQKVKPLYMKCWPCKKCMTKEKSLLESLHSI